MTNPYTSEEHRAWQTVEHGRLFSMDEWLLAETWALIEPLVTGTVLDIGAGPGLALEARLHDKGVTRFALDRNRDFVLGLPAPVQADITCLPMPKSSVPLLHARAVLGWLSDELRAQAAAELIRVSSSAIFVADFDWSTLSNDGTMGQLKGLIISTLEGFGFDPAYGRRLHEAFDGLGWAFSRSRIEPQAGPGTEGVVHEAMEALIGGLRLFGDDDRANEVQATLDKFLAESVDDPYGYRLPAICVVSGPLS
ncbi:MAG: hypothetical protein GY925_25155 [Actinomycetia bacterium]|nr:hypothetical protein [Actinomycetes bacterium]